LEFRAVWNSALFGIPRCLEFRAVWNSALFGILRPLNSSLFGILRMNFGEFAPDGQIRRIVGFFGAPPTVSPK
jgi:hypothetical protein